MSGADAAPEPPDWGDYAAWDPGVLHGPAREAPRREARAHFDALMAERPERVRVLTSLLARNGIEPDGSDDSVVGFTAWYRDHAEAAPENPERLAGRWFAVARDAGLWLGDLAVARNPDLAWTLGAGGKTSLDYNLPVLMGFRWNPRYDVNFEGLVQTLGHRAIASRAIGDRDLLDALLFCETGPR